MTLSECKSLNDEKRVKDKQIYFIYYRLGALLKTWFYNVQNYSFLTAYCFMGLKIVKVEEERQKFNNVLLFTEGKTP